MLFFLRFSLLAVVVALAAPANAATFVVDSVANTADQSLADGLCRTAAATCTLRAAIQQANSSAGADRIEFAIPGAGPHTISPVSPALPTITSDLTIDGYTQPGASENDLPFGTNAQIQIAIEGTYGAGIFVHGGVVVLKGLAIRNFATGVTIAPSVASVNGSALLGNRIEICTIGVSIGNGSGVRVGSVAPRDRNLISNDQTGVSITGGTHYVVNNLIGIDATGTTPVGNTTGISIGGGLNHAISDNVISANGSGILVGASNGNTIVRNLIGLSADGSFSIGNSVGIRVTLGSNNQIGLPNPAHPYANANVISGSFAGVQLRGNGNTVAGNFFGTGPGGSGAFPNRIAIEIEASGNVIGAAPWTRGEANVISVGFGPSQASPVAGIVVRQPLGGAVPLNNSLRTNRIFGNGNVVYDIDLADDRLHHDDPGDVDAGPNNLQNAPMLDLVSATSGKTTFDGSLDAPVGEYTLDFYSSSACDLGADSGSAEFFLGSDVVRSTGTETLFTVELPVTAQGLAFTAMATDEDGNSSELAPCYQALVANGADVSVSAVRDDSLAIVAPGDDVRFEVTARNAGPATATDVPVLIVRPAGFDTWTSGGNGNYDEPSGVWSVGDLEPGATATRFFDARIGASAAGLLTVVADAEQGLTEPDPDLTGNRSSASFDVQVGADLVLTQSTPVSARPGDSISLGVTVRNAGPEDARDVTLSGHLDAGFELDVANAPAGIVYNPGTGNWSLPVGEIAVGDIATITLPVRVSPATPLGQGLNHTLSASGLPADPAAGLSTSAVAVGALADLAVAEIIVDTRERPGTGGYTKRLSGVRFENLGPDDVSAFDVTFECPGGLIEVLDSPTSRQCFGDETRRGCPIHCAFGEIRSGESLLIEFFDAPDELTVTVASHSAAPFFDSNPANDVLRGIVVNTAVLTAVCGLFGIEALVPLGLVLLLRGRRGRAAFRRVFPGTALVLALSLGGYAPSALAAPIAFTVDPAASSGTVMVTSTLGSPPAVAISLSGSLTAEVALANSPPFGLAATSLQLTDGALALSDFEVLLASPPLYALSLFGAGVGASLSGPLATGFPVAPGLSLFDLGGSAISFDTGSFRVTGTFFGVGIDETLALATSPFVSIFPINSVAQLQVADLGGGSASLRLSLPFSAPLHLSVNGEPVTVTITGTVVANGVSVPEPSSALLLALALFGFAGLRNYRSAIS